MFLLSRLSPVGSAFRAHLYTAMGGGGQNVFVLVPSLAIQDSCSRLDFGFLGGVVS